MKIVYASDNSYYTYVYASVYSLLESNKNNQIEICYIYQDVPKEALSKLTSLAEKYFVKIEYKEIDLSGILSNLPAYSQSKTTWVKFLFASMFPNDERVLFLDPDTLVLRDISELFLLDMGDNLIGGIPECLPQYHKTASLLSEDNLYINGGMVLCNLLQWRLDNFEEKAKIRLQRIAINLNYDQGILNELCKGRVLRLDAKYCVLAEMFTFASSEKLKRRFGFKEYYTQQELMEAIENPAIVHFTGFLYLKPFSKNCTHPYAKVFWEILKKNNYDFTPDNSTLNYKQRFRKFILENMPFSFFLLVEKIFDIRRSYMLGVFGNMTKKDEIK